MVCIERAGQDAGPIAQGLNLRGLAQVVQLGHLPSLCSAYQTACAYHHSVEPF